MKKYLSFLVSVIFITLLNIPVIAATTTIFSEDFESYNIGSNLSGQGGWFGDVSFIENASGGLTGKVSGQGSSSFDSLFHTLPSFQANKVYIINTDSFTTSSPHNQLLEVRNSVASGSNTRVFFNTERTTNPDMWRFNFTDEQGNSSFFNTGVATSNTTVQLSMVIDTVDQTIQGLIRTIDGNSTLYDSGLISVSNTMLTNLDEFLLGHRINNGTVQFDNIQVTETSIIPEPSTFFMLLLCILGLSYRQKKIKNVV